MAKKSFLDSIKVPAPCDKNWEEMTGGEQKRFCSGCKKNVYNISAMPRREARKLVAQNAGKICIRYARLPNGRVETADRKLYSISRRASAVAAGVIAVTLTISTMTEAQTVSKTPNSFSVTQIAPESASQTKISIIVTDQNGAIIPNARIILTDKNGNSVEGISNEQGLCEFTKISPSIYEIKVSIDGFKPLVKSNLSFTGEKTLEIKLSLEAVLNSESNVSDDQAIIGTTSSEVSTSTTSRQLEELPRLKNGYFLGLVAGTMRKNKNVGSISFTIYDPNNTIIPGAQVKLTDQKTKAEFNAIANQNGTAQFGLIPHGRYDVLASFAGFNPFKQFIQVKEDIEPNISITLEIGTFTGVVTNDWSEIPLFQSIAQEDNQVVEELINSGFNFNTKDSSGKTALHVAVEHENLEIVRFLLEKGAKVNAQNKNKISPLLMLEDNLDGKNKNTVEILRLLIAKGANVNARNIDKQTLLMLACDAGNLEIVKTLLEAKADPNLKDEDGETALKKTDSDEIKRLLQSYGAR